MQQPQPSGRPVPSADRRGPALRCCPHRVCVLPASAADDCELPAVPQAQGLALRWPLHELHQGGESRALPGMPPVAGEEQRAGVPRCGSQSEVVFVTHRLQQVTSHLRASVFPVSQGTGKPGRAKDPFSTVSLLLSLWMQGLWLPFTGKYIQSGPWVPGHCSWLSGLVG